MSNMITTSPITRVVLLGTGTPNADPLRFGPSVAVVVNDQPYLVDFGPGVVRRAAAAVANGVKELAPSRLTRAFVTHLHSDHTSGYPDLIFTPGVIGRNQPLEIFGPMGLRSMTNHIMEAYREDLRERIEGLEPTAAGAYDIQAHEIQPGVVYQDENVQVTAFSVRHGTWPAYGYKFVTPDRTIVVSGDTAPSINLVKHARDCDTLVHEVYSGKGFSTRSANWQKYHSNMHTSTHELAEIALQIQPKLLVLYHQLFWNATEEELLAEIRSRYSGNTVSGHDLDVF